MAAIDDPILVRNNIREDNSSNEHLDSYNSIQSGAKISQVSTYGSDDSDSISILQERLIGRKRRRRNRWCNLKGRYDANSLFYGKYLGLYERRYID